MEDKYSKVKHFAPAARVIVLVLLVIALAVVVVRLANHRRKTVDQAQKAGENSEVTSNTTANDATDKSKGAPSNVSDKVPQGIDDQRSSSNGPSATVPSAGISFPLVSLLTCMVGAYAVIFTVQNRHRQLRP